MFLDESLPLTLSDIPESSEMMILNRVTGKYTMTSTIKVVTVNIYSNFLYMLLK